MQKRTSRDVIPAIWGFSTCYNISQTIFEPVKWKKQILLQYAPLEGFHCSTDYYYLNVSAPLPLHWRGQYQEALLDFARPHYSFRQFGAAFSTSEEVWNRKTLSSALEKRTLSRTQWYILSRKAVGRHCFGLEKNDRVLRQHRNSSILSSFNLDHKDVSPKKISSKNLLAQEILCKIIRKVSIKTHVMIPIFFLVQIKNFVMMSNMNFNIVQTTPKQYSDG